MTSLLASNSLALLPPENQQALKAYLRILEIQGPAGLEFLNARVPHRYTAVYQLDGKVLRNRYLFDKQGEVLPEALAAVGLNDSFCQFVLRDGQFLTGNSGNDARLDGHMYQGVVNAYTGLPLQDNRAQLYGTLCHFDVMPLDLPDQEFEFLQQVCKVLPRYLGLPAHTAALPAAT